MCLLLILGVVIWPLTIESKSLTGLEMQTDSPSRDSGLGCYRFRFVNEGLTPRKLQVMFCYTSFAASNGGVYDVLECMDIHGIKPDDEDMEDVIQFMPQVNPAK